MSLVMHLVPETLERFSNLVGESILATLTTIRTTYVDDREEYSGTGLLISDGSSKYVLTADHVLSPHRRTPPRKTLTKRHYHALNLRRNSQPSKAYALRNKFYRSESLDLALAESTLSQRPDFDSRLDYFPIEHLKTIIDFDAWNEDLFVVCGFPQAKITAIPVVNEVDHGMLIHYFSGADGGNDPEEKHRYRFKYDGQLVRPSGLSGSPVWLLRDRNNPHNALSPEYLNEKSGKELSIAAIFCGIVCEYFPEAREISAARREVCSAFVMEAIGILPTLRSKEEEEWITEQLAGVRRP